MMLIEQTFAVLGPKLTLFVGREQEHVLIDASAVGVARQEVAAVGQAMHRRVIPQSVIVGTGIGEEVAWQLPQIKSQGSLVGGAGLGKARCRGHGLLGRRAHATSVTLWDRTDPPSSIRPIALAGAQRNGGAVGQARAGLALLVKPGRLRRGADLHAGINHLRCPRTIFASRAKPANRKPASAW